MDAHYDPRETQLDLMAIADRLNDPQVEEYLSGNRHRLATTRAVLELLEVPLPNWAERNISGRAAVTKAAIERWRDDNPHARLSRGYVPPNGR